MKIDWKKEIKMPRLSLSWLKGLLHRGPSINIPGPSLKGPSAKRSKALGRGPQVKMPRLLTDLYADLRDRHLLPVVALLLAAIIAAPILLGGKGEKKEPTAVAPIAGEESVATGGSSFTVVPAARDLRSPSKRLGHRTALNPFRVPASGPESSDAEVAPEGSGSESGGGTSTGGGESASPEPSSSGGGAPAPETTTPESTPAVTPEHTSSTTEHVTVNNQTVSYTVDLMTGVVPGELKEATEVAPMTKLPSAKDALVLFVGLSQDNQRALFLMTSKVTAYSGDVHCAVDKQACQMVELKVGKAAVFTTGLGETEQRYKIVLKAIEPVVKTTKSANAKTVERTTREHPAERGAGVSAARSFSK
jgi:hypothetical protein